MHFVSAKGEGHVNVWPPNYTLNQKNCIAGEPNGWVMLSQIKIRIMCMLG